MSGHGKVGFYRLFTFCNLKEADKGMIVLEEVGYKYCDGTQALAEISLKINPGEVIAVVGPNGSGKTTLAKLFNGLLIPIQGRVTVEGMDTKDKKNIWDIRRKVGLVFQNPENSLVGATVEEDVAFGPENLGLSPDEIAARVKEALKAVGMEENANRASHMLSGGQKQKVAVAGILALGCHYLVLDEATSMLDTCDRDRLLSLLWDLNRKKCVTIIMITHNMEEAALASRIVALQEGRVAFDGVAEAFFSHDRLLGQLGLELPRVTLLGNRLKNRGLSIETPVLSEADLVKQICCCLN